MHGIPTNDLVEDATVLTGSSGSFMFDFYDASAGEFEFSFGGIGPRASVWYRYTAPRSAYLEVTYDYYAQPIFEPVDLTPFAQNPVDATRFDPQFDVERGYPDPDDKVRMILPMSFRQTRYLQFSTRYDAEGTGNATYRLITGGAFNLFSAQLFRTSHEGDGTMTIEVRRDGGSDELATVNYTIADGTATAGQDYNPATGMLSGTLTFPPGVSQQTIVLNIIEDATPEGSETLTVNLGGPSSNALLGNTKSMTLVIQDNEGNAANDNFANRSTLPGASGAVTLPAAPATRESAEPRKLNQTLWYTWTAPAAGVLSLKTANAAGPAFRAALFTGTALDSLTQIRAIGTDSLAVIEQGEASSNFVVQAGGVYQIAVNSYDLADSAPATLTYSLDTTIAVFRFARARQPVTEKGGPAKVEVLRLGSTAGPASVYYRNGFGKDDDGFFDTTPLAEGGPPGAPAAAKIDYEYASGYLEFAAGESSKIISVPIIADSRKEGEEHFRMLMEASSEEILDYPAAMSVDIQETRKPTPELFPVTKVAGALTPKSGAGVGQGTVQITIPATGRFTGSLRIDGKRYGLRGVLPPLQEIFAGQASEATLTVGPRDKPLTVKLRFEIGPDWPTITGSVSDGTFTSTFAPPTPASFLEYAAYRVDGQYTMALVPDANVPTGIRAPGFFTLNVDPAGSAKIAGRLPDGTAVLSRGFLTAQGAESGLAVSFCASLYGNGGYLAGALNLDYPGSGVGVSGGDGGGKLVWLHPVLKSGPAQTAFIARCDSLISRYLPTNGLALKVTPTTALEVKLTGAGIADTTIPFNLLANNKVAIGAGAAGSPVLTIKGATGLFSGSVKPAGSSSRVTFQGVLLPNGTAGRGFFMKTGQTGSVILRAP